MLNISRNLTRSLPRQMHVLVVPEHTLHDSVTPYHNGVPVNQVRALKPSEKQWEFWTSSNAFTHKDHFPSPFVIN